MDLLFLVLKPYIVPKGNSVYGAVQERISVMHV